jgi:hypothetical protein
MLFHFANAPLLPLVGQKLAAAYPKEATAMMSACIVAAQMVMLPIALLVGRKADVWAIFACRLPRAEAPLLPGPPRYEWDTQQQLNFVWSFRNLLF